MKQTDTEYLDIALRRARWLASELMGGNEFSKGTLDVLYRQFDNALTKLRKQESRHA